MHQLPPRMARNDFGEAVGGHSIIRRSSINASGGQQASGMSVKHENHIKNVELQGIEEQKGGDHNMDKSSRGTGSHEEMKSIQFNIQFR